ncbi:hypothetical protein TcCL_NonESM09558 [Trypanosoma cruzi]|nr:hypothetical protein TcCL_NonESM09558 [Trypanosoma cruzi]
MFCLDKFNSYMAVCDEDLKKGPCWSGLFITGFMIVLVVHVSELALNTLLKDYWGAGILFENRGAFVNDGPLLTRHKGAEQVSVTYKRVSGLCLSILFVWVT